MGIHVWYIYPPLYRLIFMVNVGKIPFVPWILWASNPLSHTNIPPFQATQQQSHPNSPRQENSSRTSRGKTSWVFYRLWKRYFRVENGFTAYKIYPSKFNSSSVKSYLPNRKVVFQFQPSFFRVYVKHPGVIPENQHDISKSPCYQWEIHLHWWWICQLLMLVFGGCRLSLPTVI